MLMAALNQFYLGSGYPKVNYNDKTRYDLLGSKFCNETILRQARKKLYSQGHIEH